MSATEKDQLNPEDSSITTKAAALTLEDGLPVEVSQPSGARSVEDTPSSVQKKPRVVVNKEIVEQVDSDNEEGGELGMADGEVEGFLDAFPDDTEACEDSPKTHRPSSLTAPSRPRP